MSGPINQASSEEHTHATSQSRVDRMARITLRPIGSPLPLGFLALGMASVVLSALQLGLIPVDESHQVAIVLLVFVSPLQLLASVFGFLARDSVGGTGLGVLGGTWLTLGAITLASPPGAISTTTGLALCFVAAALIIPTTVASFGKVLAAGVMFAAAVRFLLSGIYELSASAAWEHVSGWWGLGLCIVALYAALAFEIEDTLGRTVLPTGRHGAGRSAVDGSVIDDLRRVDREAGVRTQL